MVDKENKFNNQSTDEKDRNDKSENNSEKTTNETSFECPTLNGEERNFFSVPASKLTSVCMKCESEGKTVDFVFYCHDCDEYWVVLEKNDELDHKMRHSEDKKATNESEQIDEKDVPSEDKSVENQTKEYEKVEKLDSAPSMNSPQSPSEISGVNIQESRDKTHETNLTYSITNSSSSSSSSTSLDTSKYAEETGFDPSDTKISGDTSRGGSKTKSQTIISSSHHEKDTSTSSISSQISSFFTSTSKSSGVTSSDTSKIKISSMSSNSSSKTSSDDLSTKSEHHPSINTNLKSFLPKNQSASQSGDSSSSPMKKLSSADSTTSITTSSSLTIDDIQQFSNISKSSSISEKSPNETERSRSLSKCSGFLSMGIHNFTYKKEKEESEDTYDREQTRTLSDEGTHEQPIEKIIPDTFTAGKTFSREHAKSAVTGDDKSFIESSKGKKDEQKREKDEKKSDKAEDLSLKTSEVSVDSNKSVQSQKSNGTDKSSKSVKFDTSKTVTRITQRYDDSITSSEEDFQRKRHDIVDDLKKLVEEEDSANVEETKTSTDATLVIEGKETDETSSKSDLDDKTLYVSLQTKNDTSNLIPREIEKPKKGDQIRKVPIPGHLEKETVSSLKFSSNIQENRSFSEESKSKITSKTTTERNGVSSLLSEIDSNSEISNSKMSEKSENSSHSNISAHTEEGQKQTLQVSFEDERLFIEDEFRTSIPSEDASYFQLLQSQVDSNRAIIDQIENEREREELKSVMEKGMSESVETISNPENIEKSEIKRRNTPSSTKTDLSSLKRTKSEVEFSSNHEEEFFEVESKNTGQTDSHSSKNRSEVSVAASNATGEESEKTTTRTEESSKKLDSEKVLASLSSRQSTENSQKMSKVASESSSSESDKETEEILTIKISAAPSINEDQAKEVESATKHTVSSSRSTLVPNLARFSPMRNSEQFQEPRPHYSESSEKSNDYFVSKSVCDDEATSKKINSTVLVDTDPTIALNTKIFDKTSDKAKNETEMAEIQNKAEKSFKEKKKILEDVQKTQSAKSAESNESLKSGPQRETATYDDFNATISAKTIAEITELKNSLAEIRSLLTQKQNESKENLKVPSQESEDDEKLIEDLKEAESKARDKTSHRDTKMTQTDLQEGKSKGSVSSLTEKSDKLSSQASSQVKIKSQKSQTALSRDALSKDKFEKQTDQSLRDLSQKPVESVEESAKHSDQELELKSSLKTQLEENTAHSSIKKSAEDERSSLTEEQKRESQVKSKSSVSKNTSKQSVQSNEQKSLEQQPSVLREKSSNVNEPIESQPSRSTLKEKSSKQASIPSIKVEKSGVKSTEVKNEKVEEAVKSSSKVSQKEHPQDSSSEHYGDSFLSSLSDSDTSASPEESSRADDEEIEKYHLKKQKKINKKKQRRRRELVRLFSRMTSSDSLSEKSERIEGKGRVNQLIEYFEKVIKKYTEKK